MFRIIKYKVIVSRDEQSFRKRLNDLYFRVNLIKKTPLLWGLNLLENMV